jgi:intein/homing endonuclease
MKTYNSITTQVDAETAELLGALAGDGFIGNYGDRKQQFMIQFTGHSETDKYYFNRLERIIKKKFPSINPTYRTKNRTLRLNMYSKEFFAYLVDNFDFPVGKKKDDLRIPSQIKKDDKLVRLFIRGLFDTDGCLYFDKRDSYKKPYPRIILEITSHKLFKEVYDYLDQHFTVTRKKKIRRSRFEIYCLEIYGHRQLQKWLEIIGFSNMKHLGKLPPL